MRYVHFPVPIYPEVNKNTVRFWRSMKLYQFPIVCANARTIHKLRGRSLDNIVITNWDYADNWIYVALSRVKTLGGLFLKKPLEHHKCKGMSTDLRDFMTKFKTKSRHDLAELFEDET
jgi:hypothetical protein